MHHLHRIFFLYPVCQLQVFLVFQPQFDSIQENITSHKAQSRVHFKKLKERSLSVFVSSFSFTTSWPGLRLCYFSFTSLLFSPRLLLHFWTSKWVVIGFGWVYWLLGWFDIFTILTYSFHFILLWRLGNTSSHWHYLSEATICLVFQLQPQEWQSFDLRLGRFCLSLV